MGPFHVGDPFSDERLPKYADPSQINQIIKGAVAAFEQGKTMDASRHNIINYFNTHPRTFFVPGRGWFDMMHIAAAYAMSEMHGPATALQVGLDVEIAEALGVIGKANRNSAFQKEDFRSNRLGAKMQVTGLDVRATLLSDNSPNEIATVAQAAALGPVELSKNEGNYGFDTFLKFSDQVTGVVQKGVGFAVEASPLGAAAKSLQDAAKGAKALMDLIKKNFPKTPPKSVCVPCQGGSGNVVGSGGDAGLTTFS
jgi:hypothetical protein